MNRKCEKWNTIVIGRPVRRIRRTLSMRTWSFWPSFFGKFVFMITPGLILFAILKSKIESNR